MIDNELKNLILKEILKSWNLNMNKEENSLFNVKNKKLKDLETELTVWMLN